MTTWLLPEGINESLPDEAESLEAFRRQLIDLYASWGYRLVNPPIAEYMESLRIGMGTELDLQTVKVTDQLTGRLMGVRADMTPQVARIDAHRMKNDDIDQRPNRLCYIGTVLRTKAAHQGGSRSPRQVGAELFGHAGIESDFEVISLMLETLEISGIENLILDIGHVGIARGLADYVDLNTEEKTRFFDMLARKSLPEINDWLEEAQLSSSDADMLAILPTLNGSTDILESAKSQLLDAGRLVISAIEYLQSLCELLKRHYPALEINIDLAESRGYAYHTGIVYAVYTPDVGHSIASGGRYDGIGKAFGNDRPATGFSTDLRTLASLSKQKISPSKKAILAPSSFDDDLGKLIKQLRAEGEIVIRQLSNNTSITPQQQNCDRKIEQSANQWIVVAIEM
ncbi:MAG: ATP phosphoribosyltransferase regulatory subunit [Aquificaceae bacterium]|nr:MAG: ATP phosphoribosyltransferase regulatory subunit [Aquificaceae bacterium]